MSLKEARTVTSSSTEKMPLIIDCDPGQDDALMLFMALNATEFDLRGIVAVAGNVPLAATELNIRILADICNRADVPLYSGCEKPLQRSLITAEYVHGKTGIDPLKIYQPEIQLQTQHGVDFIIETLAGAAENEITIVATGPLTNIATALTRAPQLCGRIKQIVMMGGAMFEGGNVTPSAEFNVYLDPEALDIVLKAGRPIYAFGLDVTHKVMSSPKRVAAIRALDNPVAQAAADMLEFFDRYDSKKYASEGAPLHDPCTVAFLLQPQMFKMKACACQVELSSELTRGHTAVDFWQVTEQPHNIYWAYDVDAEAFFTLLTERLARY
ncbi:MAG: nucleoside hydrolase [Pseudomonadales bacterium]|nr:nucleoside hydrolase [Pseudomonadales bacterium]